MSEKTTAWSLVRMAAVLTLICTLVAALLSVVYGVTKEPYQNNLLETKQKAIASLYGMETVDTVALPVRGTEVEELYRVEKDGVMLGYCANVKSAGFGGDIDMMVAAGPDGKLRGVKIVAMSETPGLGSRVEEPQHLEQYRGYDVMMGSEMLDEQIDAVSGATISSKAVNQGVKMALEEIRMCFGDVVGFDANEGGSPE